MIRWTRTEEALGLLNAELAQVEHVEEKHLIVRSLEPSEKGWLPTENLVP